jgi:hypothetical protein
MVLNIRLPVAPQLETAASGLFSVGPSFGDRSDRVTFSPDAARYRAQLTQTWTQNGRATAHLVRHAPSSVCKLRLMSCPLVASLRRVRIVGRALN